MIPHPLFLFFLPLKFPIISHLLPARYYVTTSLLKLLVSVTLKRSNGLWALLFFLIMMIILLILVITTFA